MSSYEVRVISMGGLLTNKTDTYATLRQNRQGWLTVKTVLTTCKLYLVL